MQNWLRHVDLLIKILSWLTIGFLLFAVVARKFIGPGFWPIWFERWCMPVLVAAAIGYLTNYLAIQLLFRPYERRFGFLQGVIPREQNELAAKLGDVISEDLLPPDELAAQLIHVAREYLHDPSLVADIRKAIPDFLDSHREAIAAALAPSLAIMAQKALETNFTPKKLQLFFEQIIVKWLRNNDNRNMLAGAISRILQSKTPEMTHAIKKIFREGTETYLREEYSWLCNLMPIDDFGSKLIDNLNWELIRQFIEKRLGEGDTREAICEQLVELTIPVREYLRQQLTAEQLQQYLAQHQEAIENFLQDYLEEQLPSLLDHWLSRSDTWDRIAEMMLAMAQNFILERLRHDQGNIIKKLDLSGRIEKSVQTMDMRQVHLMINNVSGKHLVALQLLGYVLGAIAGVLMTLIQ